MNKFLRINKKTLLILLIAISSIFFITIYFKKIKIVEVNYDPITIEPKFDIINPTFTINNNIKGDLSDSTQFELPGGCVDEICEYIEDQSIFNLGEELRLNLYDFNGKLSIVCGPFGIKQLPKIPIQPKYGNLDDYYKSIDYSCNQDRDCVIKDTHNCCGYYPKCTNKNAVVDTEFVNSECGKEGLASVCGFPSINYCTCSENLCEGSFIEVNSFDECVAEGNPVMESYPRQCRSSEGVTFIEEI